MVVGLRQGSLLGPLLNFISAGQVERRDSSTDQETGSGAGGGRDEDTYLEFLVERQGRIRIRTGTSEDKSGLAVLIKMV